jgi:hypothetical protein
MTAALLTIDALDVGELVCDLDRLCQVDCPSGTPCSDTRSVNLGQELCRVGDAKGFARGTVIR